MHPAPSVIAFTTLSGAGFGLLFWLGLGLPDVSGWVAFAFYAIGFALAAGGLLAATLRGRSGAALVPPAEARQLFRQRSHRMTS